MKKYENGAVLVTVLVVVVALVILLSSSAALIREKLSIGYDSKLKATEILAVHNKVNELKYLLATQRTTVAGLSTGTNSKGYERRDGFWVRQVTSDEHRIDGSEFKETVNGAPITIAIQADNGLIPINTSKLLWLEKLFDSQNVPSIEQNRLKHLLLDYIDNDDWTRPLGAEVYQYETTELEPPLNYLLPNCGTLKNIYGWGNYLEANTLLSSYCKISRSPAINLNAIPSEILKQLWPNYAPFVLERRKSKQWYINQSDVIGSIPGAANIPEPYFTYTESTYFHLKISGRNYDENWFIVRGSGESPPILAYKQT